MFPPEEAPLGQKGQVPAHRGLGNPQVLRKLPGAEGPVVPKEGEKPIPSLGRQRHGCSYLSDFERSCQGPASGVESLHAPYRRGHPAQDPRGRSSFGLWEAYLEALTSQGLAYVLIPPQPETALERLLRHLDGILLPGGGDVDPALYGEEPLPELGEVDPKRDGLEVFLARYAAERGFPSSGCAGESRSSTWPWEEASTRT